MRNPNDMNATPAPQESDENPQRPWAYRTGMAAYRATLNAFFAGGGLTWLRKKYRVGLDERLGSIEGAPSGGLWIHAVSVGEVQSAAPLIRLAKRDTSLPCVLSTVTPTGRKMAEQLIGPLADRMIYNPWDRPRYVSKALDTLSPLAYVAMETERWPQMLSELRSRKIPAFLANGRLSLKSMKKLKPQAAFWREVLDCFTRILVRFEEDREHFEALGVGRDKILVTGDCKVDALIARKAEGNAARFSALRRDGAPLFVAGSTHAGEDETVLEAFREVRRRHPRARLVVVPRHPERALSVVAAALPLETELFSRLPTEADWDVLVVDRIGVLFDLYAASDAAFVGGSLLPHGGQNVMEPALFDVQTTHGPHTFNFPDTPRMDELGAAIRVETAHELAAAWLRAPGDKERTRKACRAYFDSLDGASLRTWEVIKASLPKG